VAATNYSKTFFNIIRYWYLSQYSVNIMGR